MVGFSDHLNPLSPQEKYLDREIYFTELATNTLFVLTSDYKDQWGPLVLEHQLVYFEMDDDTMSMRVHSWEPEPVCIPASFSRRGCSQPSSWLLGTCGSGRVSDV